MNDIIKRGDRVSWQSSTGFEPRRFGVVIAKKTAHAGTPFATKQFRVIDDDGTPRIVPARFVTKECG